MACRIVSPVACDEAVETLVSEDGVAGGFCLVHPDNRQPETAINQMIGLVATETDRKLLLRLSPVKENCFCVVLIFDDCKTCADVWQAHLAAHSCPGFLSQTLLSSSTRARQGEDFVLGQRVLSRQAVNGCQQPIQRGEEFTAIEVKAKENLSSHDFKGLKAIGELKGISRRLVVFLGERPFRTEEGLEALPVRSFLDELKGKTL